MADVVVVGGAGRTGRRIIAALRQANVASSAMAHREEARDAALAVGAESVTVGELADVDSLVRCFDGSRTVVVVPPALNPQEDQFIANAVDAAGKAGVERFVLYSVLHPFTASMPHHMRKARAEAAVRDAEFSWTILQPAMYAQSVARYRSADEQVFRVPFALDRRFSVVDMDDVVEVAVSTVVSAGHDFATYELAGPEALPMATLVTQFGEAVGIACEAVEIDPELFPSPPNWSESALSDARAMYAEYGRHGMRGNANVLRSLLGREPTTFATATRREHAAGTLLVVPRPPVAKA